jgi:uncharacterized membrane protein
MDRPSIKQRSCYKPGVESEPLAQELTDQDRVLLVFAYLGPLALLSLIAARRELVKWHAKQGALLALVTSMLWLLARGVYLLIRPSLWPWLGVLFGTLAGLTALGLGLVLLFCIVRALEGERFKIPLLGEIVDSM